MISAITSHPVVQDLGKWFAKFGKKADNAVEASLVTYIPESDRKFNQLKQRGWTKESINDLVNDPYTNRKSLNQATGNKATVYYTKDGNYIPNRGQ